MDDQKNMIMAAVLSFLVIAVWFVLFPPEPPVPVEETVVAEGTQTPGEPGTAGPDAGGVAAEDRDAALTRTGRINIQTPSVWGSLSLKGGRIDDLHLSDYFETLAKEETVLLLNPTGSPHPYFAAYGWKGTGAMPNVNTDWTQVAGEDLTPGAPVTLEWDNGEGLIFRREIAVDEKYMFTVRQSVENTTGEAVELAPFGYVARYGRPDVVGFYIQHEGSIGAADGVTAAYTYEDGFLSDGMDEFDPSDDGTVRREVVSVEENGWIGFTDKYWMTVLAPKPGQAFTQTYLYRQRQTGPEYRTEMTLPVMTIAAGATETVETSLFAGAKEYQTIVDYEDNLGIDKFTDSIDWGWFFFLTEPIFQLLLFFKSIIGNMGWSILALTLTIKIILVPLAYKSYVSMAKMKKLQPEMEKIKERVGDDRQKMQQEMMALYKREKANPAAGCLPILVQIPIFFSLYKVLFVTLEMRHAPFIGWIQDLSAPDPTSWMNIFGLLPFDAPMPGVGLIGLFSIGVFPILMGVTMWLQQKLNPAPTDPTQAAIFAWMPWVFMFMLGTFASGLVIYWCANNIITFAQQFLIMRSQGVDVDILGNIKQSLKKTKPAEEAKAAAKVEKAAAAATETVEETIEDAAEAIADDAPKKPAQPRKKKSGPSKSRRRRNN